MPKKLAPEKVEERILQRCQEMNYTLIEPFIYQNNQSLIHLRCNLDGYEWNPMYYNFITNKTGCPKCDGNLKLTQKEAEEKVIKRCQELNYTIIKPFIYENCHSRIYLKCNSDNLEWNVNYNHFINNQRGCPKCGRRIKNIQ